MKIQADRLRPILFVEFAFIACVVSLLLFTQPVRGQDTEGKKAEFEFRGKVEIGAQFRDIQGGHTAKFEEVRDVPKGLFVQKLSLDIDSDESPYFIRLRGFELRERDQRFSAEIAKVGKFRFNFLWDQVPHHFGDGQSFLQETSPGVYQVSPTLRAALQALTLPDNVRTPPNGPLPTLVRQELLAAPLTKVRLRRD